MTSVTACGGGMMPYVPTGYSGSGSSGSSNTQDKNFVKYANSTVSDEVFNIEQLQPLLRKIRETGNERKKSQKGKEGENVLNFDRIH